MDDDLTATEPRFVIEDGGRLSRSCLWRAQRAYYERRGLQAWSEREVPDYVTTNPYVAGAYVTVLLGWLEDLAAAGRLSGGERAYVIEVGAGSGRFAYHVLRGLARAFAQRAADLPAMTYVMTDFHDRIVDAWRAHAWLRPFVEAGLLDFARFDAERDDALTLRESGAVLAAAQPGRPLAVIANYVFHALPQDAFCVRSGVLHEQRVTVASSRPVPDREAGEALGHLRLEYAAAAVSTDYYDDPAWNRILAAYQAGLPDTSFSFPSAALRAIGALAGIGGGRMLLIAADKGYVHDHELVGRVDAELVRHGSVSLAVNLNAIARHVTAGGGSAMTARYSPTLCIAAFVLDAADEAYRRTRAAYEAAVVWASPADFFVVRQAFSRRYAEVSVAEILSFLRLSRWDPTTLVDGFEALIGRLDDVTPAVREELRWSIHQAWDAYFPIGEAQDVPFFFGMLLQRLGYQAEALVFFERSLAMHGPDPRTFYQAAVCRVLDGDLDAALVDVDQSLALAPLAAAAELRATILASRAAEAEPPAP